MIGNHGIFPNKRSYSIHVLIGSVCLIGYLFHNKWVVDYVLEKSSSIQPVNLMPTTKDQRSFVPFYKKDVTAAPTAIYPGDRAAADAFFLDVEPSLILESQAALKRAKYWTPQAAADIEAFYNVKRLRQLQAARNENQHLSWDAIFVQEEKFFHDLYKMVFFS